MALIVRFQHHRGWCGWYMWITGKLDICNNCVQFHCHILLTPYTRGMPETVYNNGPKIYGNILNWHLMKNSTIFYTNSFKYTQSIHKKRIIIIALVEDTYTCTENTPKKTPL